MPSTFAELRDRTSATVQAALTRLCVLCKAQPNTDCANVISGAPLPGGNIVHYARTGR